MLKKRGNFATWKPEAKCCTIFKELYKCHQKLGQVLVRYIERTLGHKLISYVGFL